MYTVSPGRLYKEKTLGMSVSMVERRKSKSWRTLPNGMLMAKTLWDWELEPPSLHCWLNYGTIQPWRTIWQCSQMWAKCYIALSGAGWYSPAVECILSHGEGNGFDPQHHKINKQIEIKSSYHLYPSKMETIFTRKMSINIHGWVRKQNQLQHPSANEHWSAKWSIDHAMEYDRTIKIKKH